MEQIGYMSPDYSPPPHPGTLQVPALSHNGERETNEPISLRAEGLSSHLPLDDGGGRVGVTWCLPTSANRSAQCCDGMLSSAKILDRIERIDQLGVRQQVEKDGEVVADAASEYE